MEQSLAGTYTILHMSGVFTWESPGVFTWQAPGQDWQCQKSAANTYECTVSGMPLGLSWVFDGGVACCGSPEQHTSGQAFKWAKEEAANPTPNPAPPAPQAGTDEAQRRREYFAQDLANVREKYQNGPMMQTAEVNIDAADIYHATDFDPYFDPHAFASLGFPEYKKGANPGQAVPITNSGGEELYVQPSGRCALTSPSQAVPHQDSSWSFSDGSLTLPDGRQLYATADGWANADRQSHTVAATERQWSLVDGVFSLTDGRELYTSAGGAGLAMRNQYSNITPERRVWLVDDLEAAAGGLVRFEEDYHRPTSPLTVLQDLARWEVIEGHCFNTHFPVNSGGVHTEEDETFVRHECMKYGYGGFHKKEGSYEGLGGTMDRPPVCFYMQKTQAELRALLAPNPAYTAYIAPPEHTSDRRFRPYAAACHVGWQMPHCPLGVTSFAVTVRVDVPTNSTYYMAIGFSGGYSGMQQGWGGTPATTVGRHQALFSVWEPTPEHPVTTPHLGEGVSASAFGGGEGNGGGAYSNSDESPLDAFQPGEEVTFLLRSQPDRSGEGTVLALMRYTERYGWKHFATHVVWCKYDKKYRGRITGLHSFIEAFGGEYGLTSRSGVWKAWGRENDSNDWFPVTQVSGSCTMDGYGDKSYENTRVGPHDGGVEMCTGGPRLNDGRGSEIYDGPIDSQPVPAHIVSAPASIFE